MKKLFTVVLVCCFFVALPMLVTAQYNAAQGFKLVWSLDPRDDPGNFTRGPSFGARSVEVGMDFDGDGLREILFTTDETLAPGGPDPGFLDIYLYEAAGNDTYNHVWHYSMPIGTNSLPALTYGDMDMDGKQEIFFGVPTIDNPEKLFIFEQDDAGVFPDQPTVTWDFGRDKSVDFRPSGLVLDDVDGDGVIELIAQSRTSGAKELVVASLETGDLDAFATFKIEFEAGNDILGGGGTYDVAVVDFDGDGKKEIWSNTWDRWTMTVFEATGADSFALQVELDALYPENDPGSFNSHKMNFLNIDSDDKLEAWFPMTDGRLYYLDDTDDVSTLTADDIVVVGTYDPTARARGSDIGDIDNDGRYDIIATHGTSEKVSRIEYLEIGSPADSSSYDWSILFESEGEPTDRYYPCRIAPVDLDGDGLKEVVLTNLYASEAGQPIIIVLEYDPSTATKTAQGWEAQTPLSHSDADELFASDFSGNSRTAIGGMDLDQDGKQEVILTDYGAAGVKVFEYNQDNDVFEMVWGSPADTTLNRRPGSNPRTVNVSDFDGDGKWEIVFPLASEPSGWYIYEWDGVVGSDNYGDTYSSVIGSEIDICCSADFKAFRADHERSEIVDIDGDGKQEMLIAIRRNASGGKRGTLITSVDGEIEHNSGGGFEVWLTEFFVDRGDYGGGSPYQALPADLDGDGTWEIVSHTWNYFNFFNIDVTGPDTYVAPDVGSATKNIRATYPDDNVSLFGGAAADVDGDGDDEAYFPNYQTGDLWVIDYKAGDDVLSIDESHVVKVVENMGKFYASIFDVDQNGKANIFVGSAYPRTIVSAELIGTDPRNPADYMTKVIYTGEPDVMRDIVIIDSAGVMTTSYRNTGVFASKVQSNFNRNGIDMDGDGKYELLASFQGSADSIKTTTITWNQTTTSWDTVITKIENKKSWAMLRFEYTDAATGVESKEMIFITPDDYVLEQNYPNPFNPSTTIQYSLPITKKVTVRIYNIMGQVVSTLIDNELQTAGQHNVIWNGKNDAGLQVATGTYIYSLEFGKFRKTRQMMLVK